MSELVPLGSLRRLPRGAPPEPRYVVWELTLRCDQRCVHCGSRAADPRDAELSTKEALEVLAQLVALGTREVTFIGGEAYLHEGFLALVGAAHAAGVRPSLTTGGRGITRALADELAAAGLYGASVSVDGVGATHDLVRATPGGFAAALSAVEALRAAGLPVGCNTVVQRLNVGELESIYETIQRAGVRAWQVQLMAALGRAADRPDLLLQPWQLLDVVPRIARLKARGFDDGILVSPGNNVGYFSADEKLLRSLTRDGHDHWSGCQAGRSSLGIESDGAVKGCPSLPTVGYVGGNVRQTPLAEIWQRAPELAFTRRRSVDALWGFCRTCPFAEVCLGGCNFTTHALFGRPGNNPYCHYRAKTLAAAGVRERLVPRERAPGEPFDHGRYAIVVEPFDAPDPPPESRAALLRVWRG